MKCDYCNLKALYSCGVIGEAEIWACDEHKYFAAFKQDSILRNLEFKDMLAIRIKSNPNI